MTRAPHVSIEIPHISIEMPPCGFDHVTTSDHVTSTSTTSQEEESTSPACQPQDQQINPAIFTDDELEDQMFQDALDTVFPPSPVHVDPPTTAIDQVTSSPPIQYDAISEYAQDLNIRTETRAERQRSSGTYLGPPG